MSDTFTKIINMLIGGTKKHYPQSEYVYYSCRFCGRKVLISRNRISQNKFDEDKIFCSKCDKDKTHILTKHQIVDISIADVPVDTEIIH